MQTALNRGEGRTGVVCGACHVEFIIGQTAEDRDFECVALREGYRPCPKCGIYIRSEGGCRKMTCRCGAQFCFECGKPREAKCGCESKHHAYLPTARGPVDFVESPVLDMLTPRIWLPDAVESSGGKGKEMQEEFYSPASSASASSGSLRKTRPRRSVMQSLGF